MKKRIIASALLCILTLQMSGCTQLDGLTSIIKTNIDKTIENVKGISATEAPQSEETVDESVDIPIEPSNSITLGVTGVDTWNPLLTTSQTVKEAMELVYEPLFEINENGEPVPVLANDYSVSADGRTIEVNLKGGVLWHDGSSFDAYDVAYTVKQIKEGRTTYSANLSDVADYKAISNSTIRFVMSRSVPDFPLLLTFPIIKYQTSMNYDNSMKPVGTGPYYFYGNCGTSKYLLGAYDYYHNGRPAIDAAYIYDAPDISKYFSMFEASEIDLMTSKTIDITKTMPKGNVSVYDYISDNLTYLGFNLLSTTLSSAPTRRGIAAIIWKDDIVKTKLYSRAESVDIPFNPSSYVYYDTKTTFRGDYETLNENLTLDGWVKKDGEFERTVNGMTEKLRLNLLANSEVQTQMQTANMIASDLEKNGITVYLDAQTADAYTAKIAAGTFDMYIGSADMNANQDPSLLTGAGNAFSYSNPSVDTAIAQIGMTADTEQKKQLFIQLGNLITQDMPFVPLYYRKESVLSSAKIKSGISPTQSGLYRLSNIWRVK